MSEEENEEEQEPSALSKIGGIVKQIPGAALLFAVVPLVLLGYFGWYYYGAKQLDQALYSLKRENLTTTKQPKWIKSDVADQVFEKQNLKQISLLDPSASAVIAQAFETHSWVKSASRVVKSQKGKVAVDLIYRKPIAMVYYHPADERPVEGSTDRPGFYPVDDESVVLSTDEFTPEEVFNFFIIDARDARPAGLGLPFGDPRISEALSLCQFLSGDRLELGLRTMHVNQDTRSVAPSPWVITLYTSDNHVLLWGHAPTLEGNGEPAAEEKLRRMKAWLEVARESSTAQVIDLRTNKISARPSGETNPIR